MPDQTQQPPKNNKYKIGKSVEYATRGFTRGPSPAPAIAELTKPPAPEELRRPVRKHAVWIVHGMGQQVPFETLDNLAAGILKVADQLGGRAEAAEPRVTVVKFAASGPGGKEQVVQRVEIDLQDKNNPARACQLHLYEA